MELSNEHVDALFKDCDENKDSGITIEEFTDAVKRFSKARAYSAFEVTFSETGLGIHLSSLDLSAIGMGTAIEISTVGNATPHPMVLWH